MNPLVRLWPFSKPFMYLFVIALVTSIFTGIIDAAFLGLIKICVDKTYKAFNWHYLTIIGLLVGALVTRSLFNVISEICLFRFDRNIVKELRMKLYSQLLNVPINEAEKHSTGELATKLIYQTEQLGTGFLSILQSVLQEGIIVISITTFLLYNNWKMTLALMVTFPLIGIFIKYAAEYMKKYQYMMQNSLESIAHFVDETRVAIKTISMQNVQSKLKSIYDSMVIDNTEHQCKINRASTLSSACSHFMISLPIVFLVWVMLAFPKYITQGDVAAIIIGMTRIYQPIKKISRINVDLQSAIVAGESLFQWLDITTERLSGDKVDFTSAPAIKVENLEVIRGKNHVIKDVSLKIDPGQIIAFAGESGSGKSSLMHAIAGLITPASGKVFINSQSLDNMSLKSWRNQIGYVDQSLPIFKFSIAENIAFFDEIDYERIAKAAYIACLDNNDFENGFNHIVDYGGQNLSNGQKQRIVLARSIYHAKNILIIDEATSALDQETESKVYRRIKECLPDMTIILASHRPAGLNFANKIFVLSDGKLVEQGQYSQLIQQNKHFAQIMESKTDATVA